METTKRMRGLENKKEIVKGITARRLIRGMAHRKEKQMSGRRERK
jgi:hypothetical protein